MTSAFTCCSAGSQSANTVLRAFDVELEQIDRPLLEQIAQPDGSAPWSTAPAPAPAAIDAAPESLPSH